MTQDTRDTERWTDYLAPDPDAWASELCRSLDGTRGRSLPLPPARSTALVFVDLQRLFLDADSPVHLPAWDSADRRARALLDAARRVGIPVLWTRHVHPHDDSGGSIARIFGRLIRPEDPLSELAPSWAPHDPSLVIEKSRHPATHGTNLVRRLEDRGVEAVVLAGVQAPLCVAATAVGFGASDILPVVAVDALAARTEQEHRAAVQTLSAGLALVATVREILDVWLGRTHEATA